MDVDKSGNDCIIEKDEDEKDEDDPMEGPSSGTNEPSKSDSSPPERPKSPESCSICLGKLENKSFTDSCFHTFCFVCLLEWSRVKAVCPLCKQPFKSIIHNVRSIEDYDQYDLGSNQNRDNRQGNASSARFRYRTTMTGSRWSERRTQHETQQEEQFERPSRRARTREMWRTRRQAATAAFRKRIYNSDTRVTEVRTACGRPMRYRDISPAFFTRNSACVHRLVPWLNRELNVLLHNNEDNVHFLLELIVELIKRFDIRSQEFGEHIRSFLHRRTDHFVHEFYTFARSPYDMIAYDEHAVYDMTNDGREPHEVSSDEENDDRDLQLDVISINSPGDGNVIVLNSDNDDSDIDIIGETGPSEVPPPIHTRATFWQMQNRLFRDGSSSPEAVLPSRPFYDLTAAFPAGRKKRPYAPGSGYNPLQNLNALPSSSSLPSSVLNAVVFLAQEDRSSHGSSNHTSTGEAASAGPATSQQWEASNNHDDLNQPSTSSAGNSTTVLQRREGGGERESTESGGEFDGEIRIKHERSPSDWENGSDIVIVAYEKPWEQRSPIPLSSAEEEIFVTKTKPAISKKKKLAEKAKKSSRSRSLSSLSSISSRSSSYRRRRRRKARRRRSRSSSSSRRHRKSRSHSISAFSDHRRRHRSRSSSRSVHRRREARRARRSRSRLRRRSRSGSRRRHSRSRSRSVRRTRPSRYSRSRTPGRRRSRSSTYRRRSRSSDAPSRSRQKAHKRSRERRRRAERSSSPEVVEYTALGKYSYDLDKTDNKRRKDKTLRSYTQEWVDNRGKRDRRDSSVESVGSLSAFRQHASGKSKKKSKRRDSIEVVYERNGKSDKTTSPTKERRSKKHKKDSRLDDGDKVVSERSKHGKQSHRDRGEGHRDRDANGSAAGDGNREKHNFKKHPTGHKKSSSK